MFRFRWLLLIALIVYLQTGMVQIRSDERGVVRRFGKVVAEPGPGLWIGWPWGIDQVNAVQVRTVRQLAVGFEPETEADDGSDVPGQFLTGDQNLVNVKLVVEYAIDEQQLADFLRQREIIDSALSRAVEATAREWIAGQAVDEVLLTGRAALPQWIMARLPERIEPLNLGVVVQRVSVDLLAPPKQVGEVSVRDAFEAVNKAQTEIRTRVFQARQESAARLREAETLALQYRKEAEATRQETLTLARADAEVFTQRLTQYRELRKRNPDILAAIWWDETSKLFLAMKARGRIDLLDHHLGANGLDVTQFVTPPK